MQTHPRYGAENKGYILLLIRSLLPELRLLFGGELQTPSEAL
jgi:hypothetical protein